MLAGHEEGEAALAELGGDVAEGLRGVGVGDAHVAAARGQVHADAVGTPDLGDGIDGFEHEAGAVFDGAAVGVGAVVGAGLQELVDEVAVGAVELDAVEAGSLGVLRAAFVVGDGAADLLDAEGAGRLKGLLGTDERDETFRRDGRGSDGLLAVEEDGVRRRGRRARSARRCGRRPCGRRR